MGKPIRIAQIIGKLNAAGVEAVINNYYRNIDHSKFQFDYFIDADSNCEPKQELIDMGAKYITIPPYQKLPQHMSALIKIFRENQYQVVHVNMNTLAVFSLCAAWIAGVPVRINHNHSTASKGETKRNILKYLLRPFAKIFATHCCGCSKYAAEWLFGKKALSNGNVTVFNNAIDINRFKYNADIRTEVRKELNIEDKVVIGHIGRFCYQKNHDFLIDIFNEICKQNDNAVLILVGIGELSDDVKNKVHKLGLDDKVKFLGVRKDAERIYQAMDVFVLPSRYEGLPVVGVEAQTSGTPCVFSDAMTAETKMAKNTIMLSLDEPVNVWAEKVLEFSKIPKYDSSVEIQAAGFDISVESKKLEHYYENCLSDKEMIYELQ